MLMLELKRIVSVKYRRSRHPDPWIPPKRPKRENQMDHKTADTKIKWKIHHRKKNPISNITKKEVYNFQSN